MADNYRYITAGLPVSKDDSVVPSSGDNTKYLTAGLPPVVLEVGTGTGTGTATTPRTPYYFRHLMGAC